MIKNFKILRFFIIIVSFLLIAVISLVKPNAKERIVDNTIAQIFPKNNDKNDNKFYIFSIQHNSHYVSALKIFRDNKFFGVGIKNFRNVCKDSKYYVSKFSCSTHPHNTYIQLLSETGFLGFVFIFTLLIFIIFFSLKHYILTFRKKYYFNDFEICLLSAILISFWPLVPTGNFFNNWLSIIYSLSISIFLWSKFFKNKQVEIKNN